ncbi:AAA family ATPase [Pseudomonas amygdali]|uniref:AAA family ATPase n=2 Tax=Pseudomonas amygdali TaxID=47877 RepID=UPI0039F5F246
MGVFFKIDSFNLLLGKNGSGKTQLLLDIASTIGRIKRNKNPVYLEPWLDTKKPKLGMRDKLCAIYYSSLPYKRKLRNFHSVIDASPTGDSNSRISRTIKLGEIANALGVKTSLTGVFGYTSRVYDELLFPALRDANNINLEPLKKSLRKLDAIGGTNENTSRSFLDIDVARGRLARELEAEIDKTLESRLEHFDQTLFLTCLEYMIERAETEEAVDAAVDSASAFLTHAGITSSEGNQSAYENLVTLVDETRAVLSYFGDPDDFYPKVRRQLFQIDGIGGLEHLSNRETPIRIEWSNLSSGLQALVEQFTYIEEAIVKATERKQDSILLLIDEGDAYLHLDWQRKYISLLNSYLGKLKSKYSITSLQLILATHSPLLAADVPGEFVTNLDGVTHVKSFAAPLDEVIAHYFGTSSLGRRCKNSQLSPPLAH